MKKSLIVLLILAIAASIVVNLWLAYSVIVLSQETKHAFQLSESVFSPRHRMSENDGYKFDSMAFSEEIARMREWDAEKEYVRYFGWDLKDKPLSEYRKKLGSPKDFLGPDTLAYGYVQPTGLFAIPISYNAGPNSQLHYYLAKRLNRPFLKLYVAKWDFELGGGIIGYFVEENNDTLSVYGENIQL